MIYKIEILPSALRTLKSLPKKYRHRARGVIDLLSEEPRPSGSKKLRSGDGLYRVRVGSYRIIYRIKDTELLVLIVRVGDRKEVYKRLK